MKGRLVPPLSPEAYERLAADIAEHGILEPIVEDEKGVVLDGHARQQIAEELGIKCPRIVRRRLSDHEKRLAIVAANVFNRELTEAQRVLLARKIEPDIAAQARARMLAGKTGPSGQLSGNWPEGRTRDAVARLVGLGSGKTYERAKKDVEQLEREAPDLVPKLELGELDLRSARVELRRRTVGLEALPSAEELEALPASIDIRCRDARDFFGDEPEADLAIFSPPYNVGIEYTEHDDGLPHHEWLDLLKAVGKVLADGWKVARICVNFPTGLDRSPYRPLLPSVLDAFGHFEPEGIIVWDKGTTGNRTSWGSWRSPTAPRVRDRTELVAVFRTSNTLRIPDDALIAEDGRRISPWLSSDRFTELTQDLWRIAPESAQRIGHPTPYPVELPQRLIELYGWPGCTVIDPFAGSGTTGVAAAELGGMRCVLIDIDEGYVRLMMKRLAAFGAKRAKR